MLELDIPSGELYNSETNRFIPYDGAHLSLEHSLVSVAKWESIHKVPFLDDKPKSEEDMLDYIRCMDADVLRQHQDHSAIHSRPAYRQFGS